MSYDGFDLFGIPSILRGIEIVLIVITSGANLADRRFFYWGDGSDSRLKL